MMKLNSKMTIRGTFKVPIYNCQVNIIVSDNLKLIINNLFRKHNYHNDGQEVGALCYNPSDAEFGVYYLLFDKSELCLNFMNHEKSHLIEYILEDRGIKAKDEVRSFLDGFLSDKIHSFFKQRKIKLK